MAKQGYAYHTDVLIDSYQKNDATQVVISTPQNFRSAHKLNATMILMKPLLNDKWYTVSTLGATYAKVNMGTLSAARPAAFLSSNYTLVLP